MKVFSRQGNLNRHQKTSHNVLVEEFINCDVCNCAVSSRQMHRHKRTSLHKANALVAVTLNVKRISSLFQNRIETYRFENENENDLDVKKFFQGVHNQLCLFMLQMLELQINIKFNFELVCQYVKINNNGKEKIIIIISLLVFLI